MASKKDNKPLVADYVSDMINTGSTKLARENTDVFVQQMLGASFQLFNQALDIAKQDAKLRAEVFTRLSKEYHEVLKANDIMSQKVIDDAAANNELIRKIIDKILQDGEVSPYEFEFLFIDLRYYHDKMEDTRREAEAERERTLSMEREAAEAAAEKSGIGKYIIGGAFGTIVGFIGKWWYDTHFKK